jgi:hypothetical protein
MREGIKRVNYTLVEKNGVLTEFIRLRIMKDFVWNF